MVRTSSNKVILFHLKSRRFANSSYQLGETINYNRFEFGFEKLENINLSIGLSKYTFEKKRVLSHKGNNYKIYEKE